MTNDKLIAMVNKLSKAIRAKCKECSCGSNAEIDACPIVLCPLYKYRHSPEPVKVEETTSPDPEPSQTAHNEPKQSVVKESQTLDDMLNDWL